MCALLFGLHSHCRRIYMRFLQMVPQYMWIMVLRHLLQVDCQFLLIWYKNRWYHLFVNEPKKLAVVELRSTLPWIKALSVVICKT